MKLLHKQHPQNIYQIQKEDIAKASSVMSAAFQDDPIWQAVFPDDRDGSQLAQSFEVPLQYTMKYGRAYGVSANLEGISLWLPDSAADMTLWRMVRSGAIAPAMKLGKDAGKKIKDVFEEMIADRKKNVQPPYFYLMALGVDPQFQNKGHGTMLLREMIALTDRAGISLYLETETGENVAFYEKLGFGVVKEITVTEQGLPMWEMLRKPG